MKVLGMLALVIALSIPVSVGYALDSQSGKLISSPTLAIEQSNLKVHIAGIRNDKGVIRIGLYNSQQAYEDKSPGGLAALRRAALPIENGEAVWQVDNLPYGTYAIKLFHDEDNSGRLKKNFIGKPKEGIGFSNNPRVTTKAPTFDEVNFAIDKPEINIHIEMINP